MHAKVFSVAVTATLWIVMAKCGSAQQTCYNYVLMSARGTSEPQGPSAGFPGMINSTLSTVANGSEYDVVYPASINLTVGLGADDIVRYINTGISSCPKQQYAILGYSQGAAAAALALARLTNVSDPTYKAIKAVVVIGNPGHVPNATANVDQFGGDTTRNYTGSVYLGGALAIPKIYYANNKTLDICWQGDPICAAEYPNASFIPNHVLYGRDARVQRMGADFLISKLQEARGDHSTVTAITTSSQLSAATTNPSTTIASTGTASITTSTTLSPTSQPGAAWNLKPSSVIPTITTVIIFVLLQHIN